MRTKVTADEAYEEATELLTVQLECCRWWVRSRGVEVGGRGILT